MKNRYIAISLSCYLAALGSGCPKASAPTPPAAPDGTGDEAHEAHEAREHGSNEPHAAEERSDLDTPVDELFARTCEHAKPTFACES